jgi:3-isopropylmalate dehydrogenase
MKKHKKILILPGDGIGPEVVEPAVKILLTLIEMYKLPINIENGLIGGAAIDSLNDSLPSNTLTQVKSADAILLGAVGGTQWEHLPLAKRPENGLLRLRKLLDLFINLRPITSYSSLIDFSNIKPEIIKDLDLLIIRELSSDIYFGEPRGIQFDANHQRIGINTMLYREHEITRIAHQGFKFAAQRNKRLCSVTKHNVLESNKLWFEIIESIAIEYPTVELTHMYVDNAAMQLIQNPKQFDVLVTTNLFGDILSDEAAALIGSIGLLPSASLNNSKQGLYEPVHGSAPNLIGKNVANPLAAILSLALIFEHSFEQKEFSTLINDAIKLTLSQGYRTKDISQDNMITVGTKEMGEIVLKNLLTLIKKII